MRTPSFISYTCRTERQCGDPGRVKLGCESGAVISLYVSGVSSKNKGVKEEMSEKKKVIYVKDLVIKADNVTFEPPRQQRRQVDPFFGPRRMEEEVEEKEHVGADEEEHEKHHEEDERRGFSWI